MGIATATVTMQNSMEVHQKIKNRTTIWSSNSTSENINSKRYMYPKVHCSIIHNSQDIGGPEFIYRWAGKEAMIYIHDHWYMTHISIQWNITHRTEWDVPICDNMNGPRGSHAKWNKLDRKTNTIRSYLYVELKENRLIDAENKVVVTRRQGDEGWVETGEDD